MYSGTNPSALRSRKMIMSAFFSLLKEKELEKISIKELMLKSDLTRQTFYQIFSSKEEIIEYYLDKIFEDFLVHSSQYKISNLCDAAKIFFGFFEDYKGPLSLIIKNGKSCVIQRKCRDHLCKNSYIQTELHGVNNQDDWEYAVTFFLSGMVAMLEKWLKEEEPSLTPKEMALLICRITNID